MANSLNTLSALLDCSACNKRPSRDSLVFCENGHMVCKACKSNLSNCTTCQGNFMTQNQPLLFNQLLDW